VSGMGVSVCVRVHVRVRARVCLHARVKTREYHPMCLLRLIWQSETTTYNVCASVDVSASVFVSVLVSFCFSHPLFLSVNVSVSF